jgi:HSP20 family protein
MMTFRDEMDRVLDDFYGRMPETVRESYEGDWLPAMDIKENNGEIWATIELPGLSRDEIKVSVKNDMLSVSGEKKQEKTEEKENVHRVERSYGYFKRTVKLPSEVESDNVKASFKDGLLKIKLPKVESKKVKEIPIQVS